MAAIYYGVDISQYQGTINWTTMAANADFVFIKAGGNDAGLYTDSQFSANQTGARSKGMQRGFYFFSSDTSYSGRSGVTDANYFISIVGTLQPGEVMVLDFDYTGASYASTMDTYCHDFLSTLQTNYGFKPTMYTSEYFAAGALSWPLTSGVSWLWIADYGIASTNFSLTIPAWSANNPDYQWLQYSSSGTGSTYGATSAHIDLDSFYAPTGNLSDFATFGMGGATYGQLNTLPDIYSTPTFTQPLLQTIATPKYNYDKVLYSNTLSYSLTSNSWPQTITGPTTNLNQTAYPVGNFTYTANGITNNATNDFGFIYASGSSTDWGSYPGNLPNVVVQPIVNDNGRIDFDVTVTNGLTTYQTVDLTINIALVATGSPSIMNGTPQTTQAIAYSNVSPLAPNKYAAYRRVSTDYTFGTGYSTIATGGIIPNILAFSFDTVSTFINSTTWQSDGYNTTRLSISMDTSYIYLYVDSALSGCYIRLYEDN